MLRITENFENGHVIRLRLDGSLTTDSYAELDKVFSRYHQGKQMIILDMAGVRFMNDESADKLASDSRRKSANYQLLAVYCRALGYSGKDRLR